MMKAAALLIFSLMLPCVMKADETGSGFFVEPGLIVTCAHVAKVGYKVDVVAPDGRIVPAKVKARDDVRDLALLETSFRGNGVLELSTVPALEMDRVTVAGFPLAGQIGSGMSASEGRVNAVRVNSGGALLQIDAVLNPGNSGGPVLNGHGAVIGVAVSKMGGARTVGGSPVPETVNFAIPVADLQGFLEKNDIPFRTVTGGDEIAPHSVFKKASQASVLVVVRANGSKGATPSKVEIFDHDLLLAIAHGGEEDIVPLFDDQVDYEENGEVSGEDAAKDLVGNQEGWKEMELEEYGIVKYDRAKGTAGIIMVCTDSQHGKKIKIEMVVSDWNGQPRVKYFKSEEEE